MVARGDHGKLDCPRLVEKDGGDQRVTEAKKFKPKTTFSFFDI